MKVPFKRKDKLLKAVEGTKLDKLDAQAIILYNHELNNFYKKGELKTVSLDFDMSKKEDRQSLKYLKSIAKKLKVDYDAVIGYAIIKYLSERQ